jgi:hypothetical protein
MTYEEFLVFVFVIVIVIVMSYDLILKVWTICHTRFLRPKSDAHRMYAQDQVVIHTVRM